MGKPMSPRARLFPCFDNKIPTELWVASLSLPVTLPHGCFLVIALNDLADDGAMPLERRKFDRFPQTICVYRGSAGANYKEDFPTAFSVCVRWISRNLIMGLASD